jgi:hypothetical protein
MNQERALQARDKTRVFYQNGIAIFIAIFTTISICLWFLSSINF